MGGAINGFADFRAAACAVQMVAVNGLDVSAVVL